jgi:serpin B
MSMILFLPKKKTREALTRLELVLNAKNLSRWLSLLKHQKVALILPKFRFESEFRLSKTLKAMGMKQAFDSKSAYLTGITTLRPFWLQWVLHKAYVEVDEQGTEAAASTGGGTLGGGGSVPILFRADHPFLFLIRDNRTENILFLGRVVNPREG